RLLTKRGSPTKERKDHAQAATNNLKRGDSLGVVAALRDATHLGWSRSGRRCAPRLIAQRICGSSTEQRLPTRLPERGSEGRENESWPQHRHRGGQHGLPPDRRRKSKRQERLLWRVCEGMAAAPYYRKANCRPGRQG